MKGVPDLPIAARLMRTRWATEVFIISQPIHGKGNSVAVGDQRMLHFILFFHRALIPCTLSVLLMAGCAPRKPVALIESVATTQPTTRLIATAPLTQFVGHFRLGTGFSAFVTCQMAGFPDYGYGDWLIATPESGFFARYAAVTGTPLDSAAETFVGPIVFVRFIGVRVPPLEADLASPGYGHMGLYSGIITVTQLLEMVPQANNQCPTR